MKKIINILLTSMLFLFVFSCVEEDDKIVLNEVSEGNISADKSTLVLNNATPEMEAIKFSFTIPTFDVLVVPQYSIEIGLKGKNFSNSQSISTTKDPATLTLTHKTFNEQLVALGAKPGEETDIEVRLRTFFSQNANYYSNVLSLKVTPFVNLKNLYLVGDATEAGWNNNNNNPVLFRDPVNVNKFHFRGYFAAGAFKVLEKLGEWHPQWGVNGSVVSVSTPNGSNEPGVFSIPSAGYYSFEIDINLKTFTLTPSTSGNVYSTIGIIGSSTPDGWNSDQDMVTSSFNPHIWKISNVSLTVGEAKFRANNDWGTNWGSNTPFSGIATSGGVNIPVNEAGNYDVYFNDLDGRYIFVKK